MPEVEIVAEKKRTVGITEDTYRELVKFGAIMKAWTTSLEGV